MFRIAAESFAQWNERVALLCAPENREQIPRLLLEACYALLPSHNGLVAIFGRDIKPLLLYDDVPAELHKSIVKEYFDGAYLLDPYYRAMIGGMPPGLYSLSDVAPPGFRHSEYYRAYYKDASTGDEVGFICHLGNSRFGYVSLNTLAGEPNFRKADIDQLRLALPIVQLAMLNFWSHLREEHGMADATLHSQLEVALGMFGDSVLTARESEIIRMYLKGHDTRSIADRLSISTHTVALHRKHAYSKLDIGSQFELFHLFIDSLSCFDATSPEDPLGRYMNQPVRPNSTA